MYRTGHWHDYKTSSCLRSGSCLPSHCSRPNPLPVRLASTAWTWKHDMNSCGLLRTWPITRAWCSCPCSVLAEMFFFVDNNSYLKSPQKEARKDARLHCTKAVSCKTLGHSDGKEMRVPQRRESFGRFCCQSESDRPQHNLIRRARI